MGNNSFFVTIHGHFYQPPRENPWIEAIERQNSASPYHDWNEKVAAECYTPNATSRIIGKHYRISDIVNNYERISFNFGPTLLRWMQYKLPDTYQAIIEADKCSQKRFSGHGNAIAQAYNHMILPLANYRDKITQVRWGLEDFKYHFNREAEAMWLPETAVDYPTIEVLIDHNLKFIILTPFQAQRVRAIKTSGKWIDVSSGDIDVTQPYRCFFIDQQGRKNKDKYVDIFFYHAGLSKGVAFDHLLRDAANFTNKIKSACLTNPDQPQLISLATDGESYGHHEPFGDMGLAYFLYIEAEQKGMRLTNFAEYLEQHPPQMEVELKIGPNGEGTSWSCHHGVGRWYRDCGCSNGGSPEWNQKWRLPLRKALDKLRDDLISIFEDTGSAYFHDPWQARDDYIRIILDRSDKSITEFFNKHGKYILTEQQKSTALTLSEMQRHAMLMYTSCGWFFADISGLETVQILKYAARALELGNKFTDFDLKTKFFSELKNAKSNIKHMGTGEDIYNNFVKPSIVSFPQIVNHYAILSTVEGYEDINSVYDFDITRNDYDRYDGSDRSLIIGNLTITSNIIKEREKYTFALLFWPNEIYECVVKAISESDNYPGLKSDILNTFKQNETRFLQKIIELYDGKIYSISDVLYEQRENLYKLILKKKLKQLQKNYWEIYQKNKDLIFELNNQGIPIPTELKIPTEFTLSHQLDFEIKKSIHNFKFEKALEIVNVAEKLNVHLTKNKYQKYFQQILEHKVKSLYKTLNNQFCDEMLQILEVVSNLKLKINESLIQNYLFQILHEKLSTLIDEIVKTNVIDSRYYLISSVLRVAYNLNFDISAFKEKLKPLEQKLSENPDFWP